MQDRTNILAELRGKIAEIEQKPILADKSASAEVADGRLFVAPGMLHEVFSDRSHDIGAATGFSLALIPSRKAIVHIQIAGEAADLGLPYGPGLVANGLDLERFILVRPKTIEEALWACEEASGCRSVDVVLLELARNRKELDFKAARRLSMKAATQKTSIVLIRFGKGRESSPAGLRWHVAPAPSLIRPFDERAPGQARWMVTLERGKVEGMPKQTKTLVHQGQGGLVIQAEKSPAILRREDASPRWPIADERRSG